MSRCDRCAFPTNWRYSLRVLRRNYSEPSVPLYPVRVKVGVIHCKDGRFSNARTAPVSIRALTATLFSQALPQNLACILRPVRIPTCDISKALRRTLSNAKLLRVILRFGVTSDEPIVHLLFRNFHEFIIVLLISIKRRVIFTLISTSYLESSYCFCPHRCTAILSPISMLIKSSPISSGPV